MRTKSLVVDLIDGAIAGAIATWVMGRVTTVLYERENKLARSREDAARRGRTAYEVAAAKTAGLLGRELSDDQQKRFGQDIHWPLGIGAGALYGALHRRATGPALVNGLVFGAAFWLLMDEGATAALGLTPGPTAFPWQTHARGLAGISCSEASPARRCRRCNAPRADRAPRFSSHTTPSSRGRKERHSCRAESTAENAPVTPSPRSVHTKKKPHRVTRGPGT